MDNLIEIKEAKSREDAESIALLARRIWTEHYTPIIGLAQVEYMLTEFQSADRIYHDMAAGGYTYYMASCNGQIAGYAAVNPDDSCKGIFLSKLYVEKSFRGKGISRQMLLLFMERAKKEHYNFIWLTVNKNNLYSIAVYKKTGFKIVEEIVTDIGGGFVMDDYKMRLEII